MVQPLAQSNTRTPEKPPEGAPRRSTNYTPLLLLNAFLSLFRFRHRRLRQSQFLAGINKSIIYFYYTRLACSVGIDKIVNPARILYRITGLILKKGEMINRTEHTPAIAMFIIIDNI